MTITDRQPCSNYCKSIILSFKLLKINVLYNAQ